MRRWAVWIGVIVLAGLALAEDRTMESRCREEIEGLTQWGTSVEAGKVVVRA